MMNLIGSHDVERAVTVLGEEPFYDGMPAIEQSRAHLSDDQYNLGMARLFMAALWQMTYPGVPCIYYGDEIAMQGFKDPYNRRPYNWANGDTYVRSRYERMIRVRNEHTALQTGELLPLYAEDDVMAFARLVRGGRDVFGEPAKDECFISLFNRSLKETKTVTLQVGDFADGVFADAAKFNKQHGGLMITVSKNFHDRFLIIDDKTLYLIGASLKDLGGKCFAFTKLDSAEIPLLKARV